MPKAPESYITVGRAYGASEAAIVIGLLKGAGIEVFSVGWNVNVAGWHLAHAMGGTHLRVKTEDADAASTLLDAYGPVASARYGPWPFIFAMLVFLWAGLPPPPSGFYLARPGTTSSAARCAKT